MPGSGWEAFVGMFVSEKKHFCGSYFSWFSTWVQFRNRHLPLVLKDNVMVVLDGMMDEPGVANKALDSCGGNNTGPAFLKIATRHTEIWFTCKYGHEVQSCLWALYVKPQLAYLNAVETACTEEVLFPACWNWPYWIEASTKWVRISLIPIFGWREFDSFQGAWP